MRLKASKSEWVARILLGLPWVVFGLNGFLHFIPQDPSSIPPAAGEFFGAMMKTGYFIPFLKASEILSGLMVLSGCYLYIGMLISAPILIQIFLFHFFLAPSLSAMAVPGVMTLALLYLVYEHRNKLSVLWKCCDKK